MMVNSRSATLSWRFALAFLLFVPVVAAGTTPALSPLPVDKVVAAVEKQYIAAYPDDP